MKHKLIEFKKLPKKEQIIEKLLTIVVQYLCPHISDSFIIAWLNDIAQEVLMQLENKHPAHSIFSTSSEQFSVWRNNIIDDHFWDQTEANQIMCILKKFFSSELIIFELGKLLLPLGLKFEDIKREKNVSCCKLCLIY